MGDSELIMESFSLRFRRIINDNILTNHRADEVASPT